MKIIQITPGAGAMFCGNCLRDNALVEALRRLGHEVLMVPLYLPLTLDEPDQSTNTPIFFGGINVYLEQKSAFFRRAPEWLHRALAARPLLKWASGRAAKTNAAELGELTLSMLRGEEGNQARELKDLIVWLESQFKPDVIFLSNALLLGLARKLRKALSSPIVCMLQGEDYFVDGLSEPYRSDCWRLMGELTGEVEQFVALSRYFGDLMRERLGLLPERVQVVYNGISLQGYHAQESAPRSPTPTLGYFARMCREKGLDILIDAFIELRRRGRVPGLQLRVGGSCGPGEEAFVESLRGKLRAAGLLGMTEFCPNVDKAGKQLFLQSLSVFSVPATYGEGFGLYVLEALAAGVPVVQPRSGAFPELIEATNGGILCAPKDSKALADGIEELLLEPERARQLGRRGQQAVAEKFSAEAMAKNMMRVVEALQEQRSGVAENRNPNSLTPTG